MLDRLGHEGHEFDSARAFGEVGVGGAGGGEVVVGEDVYFGDAARHARAELLLRKAAAAVQHQRAGADGRDGVQAVKVQPGRLLSLIHI